MFEIAGPTIQAKEYVAYATLFATMGIRFCGSARFARFPAVVSRVKTASVGLLDVKHKPDEAV